MINRVSNLFKGHPDLIVGFNTFLPPGYKIEVQANETISVHQPGQGVMSLSAAMGQSQQAQAQAQAAAAAAAAAAAQSPQKTVQNQTPPTTGSTQGSGAHHSYHQPQRASQDSLPSPQHSNQQQQASQPVEFNHAINYVNKIKVCRLVSSIENIEMQRA